MIEIKISGADFHELRQKAMTIFNLPVAEHVFIPEPRQGPLAGDAPADPNKRRPGRQPGFSPKKNAAEAEMAKAAHDYVAPKTEPAPANATPPTLEVTKAAVNKVLEAKGVKFAHECIKHFGANRITELDPTKWHDLIKHCEATL